MLGDSGFCKIASEVLDSGGEFLSRSFLSHVFIGKMMIKTINFWSFIKPLKFQTSPEKWTYTTFYVVICRVGIFVDTCARKKLWFTGRSELEDESTAQFVAENFIKENITNTLTVQWGYNAASYWGDVYTNTHTLT